MGLGPFWLKARRRTSSVFRIPMERPVVILPVILDPEADAGDLSVFEKWVRLLSLGVILGLDLDDVLSLGTVSTAVSVAVTVSLEAIEAANALQEP